MVATQTTATELGLIAPSRRHNPSLLSTAAPPDPDPDPALTASLAADALVPDGGREAYLVLLGCSILTFWFVGNSYSWGVMQASLLVLNANNAAFSPSTLAFVGGLVTACIAALGLVNARVVQRFGARASGLVGLGCLGAGEALGSWCTGDLAGLFVLLGGLMGVGTSLLFMVVSTTPMQYFNKKRGIANGAVYAAGGVGGAAISFIMDALIHKVGPAWTLRSLGLMMLATGLPAAWIVKDRVPRDKRTLVEWRLLRSPRFIIIFLVGTIGTFPLLVPPFFLPLYASSLRLSSSAGAGLVAGFNLSSAAGRLACGVLSDRIGALNTLILALALTALSILSVWPSSSSLSSLTVFVVICGASNGGFFSTMPVVVGAVFGSERVATAMGMVVTGWLGGYLMGAPIAGFLLEAYGGDEGGMKAYRPAIYYAGSMALGATGLAVLARGNVERRFWRKV